MSKGGPKGKKLETKNLVFLPKTILRDFRELGLEFLAHRGFSGSKIWRPSVKKWRKTNFLTKFAPKRQKIDFT